MTRRPRLRKFVLTAHVISSVGWIGAVAVFLALSVVGLTSQDAVRAIYLAMEPAGWAVLVPLSLASLLTGLVQSLGTNWGLLRKPRGMTRYGQRKQHKQRAASAAADTPQPHRSTA